MLHRRRYTAGDDKRRRRYVYRSALRDYNSARDALDATIHVI